MMMTLIQCAILTSAYLNFRSSQIAESDASSLRRQQQFDKKEKDYLQVLNYESSRQQAFQRIVAESESSVLDTVSTLEVKLTVFTVK